MELENTRAFVKVIQYGSFTKAALALRLPKSSISRMVSRLEEETGTKLLVRTTRNLTLTAAGRAFYETCVAPLNQLEEAKKSLFGKDSIVAGTLRITAPEDMGGQVLAPCVAALTLRNPEVRFELVYTEETLDLVKEGIDLAVRIGKLNASSFRVRKVGEITLGLVAAPSYLRGREKIRLPHDLLAHNCLSFTPRTAQMRWSLKSGKRTEHLPITSRIHANQMSTLVNLSVAGAGVGLVPTYLCRDLLANGKLVRVLPEWTSGASFPVSVVTPAHTAESARLKLVRDAFVTAIETALKI